MSRNYLIVADDFTGANDTGVQMRRRGLVTTVLFAGRKLPEEGGSVVIDTESRGMTPEKAEEVTGNALKGVDFSSFTYVIKKVDSTLRGNVAAEIKAVDKAFGSELVVFAPSLPDLGRTTEGGVHKLNGVPITQTEIAKDPKKPVTQDNVQKLLQGVYDEPVSYLSLQDIRNGKPDFSKGRLFACDSVKNSDLQILIHAAKSTGKKVLWVGTAAMADNIMELESPTKPALGVVASVSAVTCGQIHQAEAAGVNLIQIPVHRILLGEDTTDSYIERAVASLKAGNDTILCSSSSYNRDEMSLSAAAGKEKDMEIWQVSEFVQKMMGEAARQILSEAEVSGVFMTGGDTAMGLLESLEADGSSILSEIAVGIPMMRLVGGRMDGLKVVTKAGAFGKEDAVLLAFRKLKEKI